MILKDLIELLDRYRNHEFADVIVGGDGRSIYSIRYDRGSLIVDTTDDEAPIADPPPKAWYPLVVREIIRANALHGPIPMHDPCRACTILMEEAGEVCKAALEMTRDSARGPRDLADELVQVAAVAIRMLEAIDGYR